VIPPRVRPPEVDTDDPIAGSVLAHQPALLAAFTDLYGTLWRHGEVDQTTKEIARLRNARTVNCPICKAIRFDGARAEGLEEQVIDLIHDGFEDGALEERHKAVLAWVDAFIREPGGEHAALRRRLEGHYTRSQIVELTAGVALFMGFSKIAVSLGGLPDEIPVHVQPTPDLRPDRDAG
jgi:alkylhydroperoxidase family enzyme